jgi:hypothetical protein
MAEIGRFDDSPSCHVSEYARRSGCSPAMDKNPRAIGTPAATNRPQNRRTAVPPLRR